MSPALFDIVKVKIAFTEYFGHGLAKLVGKELAHADKPALAVFKVNRIGHIIHE